MTTFYTKEQIDSIGTLIGNEINSQANNLKQFVQQEIDKLEPSEPVEGGSGGGAGGTYLDDGREIKHKLVTQTVNGDFAAIPHGLNESDILSIEVSILNTGRYYKPNGRQASGAPDNAMFYMADFYDGNAYLNQIPAGFNGSQIRVFITYLAPANTPL